MEALSHAESHLFGNPQQWLAVNSDLIAEGVEQTAVVSASILVFAFAVLFEVLVRALYTVPSAGGVSR